VAIAISPSRTSLSGWQLAAVRVVVTVVIAQLSYALIELPIRRGVWFRGRVAKIAVPAAGIATAVIILVATAGATAPPSFLVNRSDSVVRSPEAPPPAVAPQATEAELGVSRVLLLGDSVADTLDETLQAAAATHGVSLTAITRPGCGMTTAVPLSDDGTAIPWGQACADGTAEYQTGAIADVNPDTVVWLSTWETSDQIFDGRSEQFGTPAGDAALLAELEAGFERLSAGGARLVLVTVPGPAAESEVHPLRASEPERRRHLTRLFRRFATAHPDRVAVADLATIVCPDGDPCDARVDGVVLRPRDGNHFEGDGPAWVGPRLYDEIIGAVAGISAAA
jgi:hypothetical protein